MDTVWILGDQLHRGVASLEGCEPGSVRLLFVRSEARLRAGRIHRQRLHLVLTAMRRFAAERADEGFEVDWREAGSFAAGLDAHRTRFRPGRVVAMEPSRHAGRAHLEALGVELVRDDRFLCHYGDFAAWAKDRERVRMEDFYRWQRRRLGVLMDGDAPCGGRWNFDEANREPPPRDATPWTRPVRSRLDDLDREVLAGLPETAFGAEPDGTWATSRRAALARLRRFVEDELPRFGPHQDAMTERSWHLAHSLLSPYLNLGLLRPREVLEAAETAYRDGQAPLASVEGFVRQILGWREYVWGLYWLWMPGYARRNALGARRGLPPLFTEPGATRMRCVAKALEAVERHGYAHHIQRLMVLGNLALLAGVRPSEMVRWMQDAFVDGAEWVMIPNVVGMALHADGGRMATKPYAAGGAYIDRMSDHCGRCPYDPKRRTGDDACPFTTLYWHFVDRHHDRLVRNPRTARAARQLERLPDRDATLAHAERVLGRLSAGSL
ncbi:MAG: cryptochrome/photolyase family protein [Myxococcota bacterium]|nr:cryptochrome/photolyase family protein [Myxococcota bacterium]